MYTKLILCVLIVFTLYISYTSSSGGCGIIGKLCDNDPANVTCICDCRKKSKKLPMCDDNDGQFCQDGCTLTRGFWQTHCNHSLCVASQDPWPISEKTPLCGANDIFGGKNWIQILHTPPMGNKCIIFAHQYIAAKLNEADGACVPQSVADILAFGDALFADCSGLDCNDATLSDKADVLADYNEGTIGPGHCGDEPNIPEECNDRPHNKKKKKCDKDCPNVVQSPSTMSCRTELKIFGDCHKDPTSFNCSEGQFIGDFHAFNFRLYMKVDLENDYGSIESMIFSAELGGPFNIAAHRHLRSDETWYVIKKGEQEDAGKCSWFYNSTAKAGDVPDLVDPYGTVWTDMTTHTNAGLFYMPRGNFFSWNCTEGTHAVTQFTPSGTGNFVIEILQLFHPNQQPQPTPAPIAAIRQLEQRYCTILHSTIIDLFISQGIIIP